MKCVIKKQFNLDQSSLRKNDLNKLSTGCAPCLKEVLKIDRQINGRSLNEIKINEIKAIVSSIFESSNDSTE